MDYIQYLTSVNRFMRSDLTNSELNVLLFVGERTLRFNKVTEKIPLRHFLDGIVDRKGNVIVAGLRMSRRTLIYALNSLRRKGLFLVTKCVDTGINIFTILTDAVEKKIKMAKLKVSKKYNGLRGGAISALGGVQNSTIEVTHREPSQTTSSSLRSERGGAAPPGTARSVHRSVKKKIHTRDTNRASLLSATKPDKKVLRSAFSTACREHYDYPIQVIAPSGREWGTYTNFLKATDFGEGFDYQEFFDWSMRNWDSMAEIELRWMGKRSNPPPAAPSLPFFCQFTRYFLEAFIAERQGRKQLSQSYGRMAKDGVVSRIQFEDVCKQLEALQASKNAGNTLSREDADFLEYGAQQLASARLEQDRMNRKVRKLQKENAKLKAKGGQGGEVSFEDLPTYEEAVAQIERAKRA